MYTPRTLGALLWRPTTNNAKTGSIPTASVAPDLVHDSCAGCPHDPKTGAGSCYAWRGRVNQGYRSMVRAVPRNPERYTLAAALASRPWSARAIRLTAIGDLTAASTDELLRVFEEARAAGLAVLAYTAQWRHDVHQWLHRHALASTATDADTAEATRRGWTVAQTIDAQTFGDLVQAGENSYHTRSGQRLLLCPHQVGQLLGRARPVQCNECRACEAGKPSFERLHIAGVAFAEHGPHAGGRTFSRLVKAAREAAR